MARMLKHRKTGMLYPYNPDLARHPDLDDSEVVDEQFAAATKARRRKGPARSRKAQQAAKDKAAAGVAAAGATDAAEATKPEGGDGQDPSDDGLDGLDLTDDEMSSFEDV